MTKKEVRFEVLDMEDAKIALVAYGVAARIARGAIKRARREGMKVGLIRPISLWPFPTEFIRKAAVNIRDFLVFEMNTGQMVEDVQLAVEGRSRVHFYGRPGGAIPTPVELGWVISRHYHQALKQESA